MKNIPALTSMRGIAALLVVFFHYNIGHKLLPDGVFIIDKFYLMVDLFFVLSGFIMVHVYGSVFSENITSRNYTSFIKSRFARIYPMHFVSFLMLLIVVVILKIQGVFPDYLNGVFSAYSIPFVLTLTHAWGFITENVWNIASWSISVEWFLYFIFPLLLITLPNKYNKTNFVIFSVCIIILFLLTYVYEPHWEMMRGSTSNSLKPLDITTTWFTLMRGMAGFVLGMITYNLYQSNLLYKLLSKQIVFMMFPIILFVGWYHNTLPDPISVALFPFFILSGIYVNGKTKQLLSSKTLIFFGNISYSIYLIHSVLMFVNVIFRLEFTTYINVLVGSNWGGFVVVFTASIAVSTFTYFYIEKPLRKIVKAN